MESEIKARIAVDGTAFRRGVTSIKADMKRFAAETASKWKEAFTVGAAVAGLKTLADKMLELRRSAEDLGVSTDFLQSIGRMAVKFGGQSEDANNALMKLAETIGQARTEGGAAEEKFTRFGVSLYDINGQAKTTEEIFKDIANRYRDSSDAATKAALALEFFGKTGRNINNILGEGADGIDTYTKNMMRLGLIASASNVNEIADAWSNVKTSVSGIGATLVGSLLKAYNLVPKLAGALSAVVFGGAGLKEALRTLRTGNESPDKRATKSEDARMREIARLEKQREQDAKDIEKIKERHAELDYEAYETADKIAYLEYEIAEARHVMLDAAKSEKEVLDAQLKIREKEIQIAKLKEKEQKKIAEHVEDEEKAIQDVINARKVEFMNLLDKFKASKVAVGATIADRMKYTEEEFANANLRGIVDPETRRQAAIYQRQVMPAKRRAQFERNRGNFQAAIAAETQAQQIMSGLDRMQGSDAAAQLVELKKQSDDLKRLASAVDGKALLTKVMMAP
jgi:hypothetical protein